MKIELNKKSVMSLFITLTIKVNKEKRLIIINAMILNNCFEIRKINIEILKKMFANLNT